MLLLVLALVTAQAAAEPFDNVPHIIPQVAAQRVSACGLGPVSVRYDSELEEHILKAATVARATDKQIACADNAASYYELELAPTLQPRFDKIREARTTALVKQQARSWLTKRGLLDRVPTYASGVTDDRAFVRKVEQLCGPRARGAFDSKFGPHAISPDWVSHKTQPLDPTDESLACLTYATLVAGFQVSFIGNEYGARK